MGGEALMGFWEGKKILVTGGAGFIGSHVVEELLRRGRRVRVTVADNFSHGKRENLKAVAPYLHFLDADMRHFEEALRACHGQDVVLNLAARVAGVGYNSVHQGTMFRENILISANVTESARLQGVQRLLVVSSACVYPRHCRVPTPETEGFQDRPEPSNEGYGWAKRMAEFLGRAYREEFGLKVAIARPYNAYGPRDHYDSEDNHVIAALIRRAVSGENPLRVWGDGSQSRAFLYVTDLARGLLDVTEHYAEADPVNLGTEEEVTIRILAEKILRILGSKAQLLFELSKPSGQPRRNCDSSKARRKMGFSPQVSLEEGLARSIEWYKVHRARGGKTP
jgi:GDP-L-fucose synthase